MRDHKRFVELFTDAKGDMLDNTLADRINANRNPEDPQFNTITITRWLKGTHEPKKKSLLECIGPLKFAESENGLEKFQELLQAAGHEPLTLTEQK